MNRPKRSLWNKMFPLSYRDKCKHLLTEEQKKELNDLYGYVLGEEIVLIEYEMSTGRDLMSDTIVGAGITALIIIPVILSIVYVVC